MKLVVASLAVIGLLTVPVAPFRYSLNDTFPEKNRFTYTEGWMYGGHAGPPLAPQGDSYVHADLKVTTIPQNPRSSDFNVSIMFYRSDVRDFLEDNLNICRPSWSPGPPHFMDVEIHTFVAAAAGEGDDNQFVANVKAHRDVAKAGLENIFFQICPSDIETTSMMVEGELTFRNPYGYMPGMDYGCLPFELVRVLASLALGTYFGYVMRRHHLTVLPVHYMILGVVVLGTFEAMSWLMAYQYMNRTGNPYCCPYPGSVIVAMIMEVLRRTTSRFLLLMICLGYGITRVQLNKREMVCVVTLTTAFLGSGILQLASSVASATEVGDRRSRQEDPLLAVPALMTDMIFLTWIYGTLANMIKELKETNETYKLQMYRALAWTLGTFVTLFTTLTIAMLAADGSHEQSWQWKWEWTQVVSWEILNFCMLTAVCIIWRPTERSAMLAYSKQLATTEGGAEEADGIEIDGIELQGPAGGQFTIGDGDGDSDDELEHDLEGVEGAVGVEVSGFVSTAGDENKNKAYSLASFEPQQNTDLT